MKIQVIIALLTVCLFSQSAFSCQIIDVQGFDGVDCLYEGYARVMEKGKWNYIDTNGRKLSDVNFDYAWEFHEGMAAVEIKNKWGFINQSGKIAIPLKYDYVWDFKDGQALVELNHRLFYINQLGEIIKETH